MTEPVADYGPSPNAAPAHAAQRAPAWLAPTAAALAVVALVMAGVLFWQLQTRLLDIEFEVARRIGEFDTSSQAASTAARDMRTTVDTLLDRVAALEGKSQETQSQQLALAAMYQELARGQDERVIADIEQTLLLAQQQLSLAGNVRAAILGLESAETRLTQLKKPQFNRLQEAIARDVARLRLLPAADIVGINARLDALIGQIDSLRLESDSELSTPAPAASAPASGVGGFASRLWQEVRQLVRVRRLDRPELPLLSPEQTYFLRQNLKLRLLSARVAVLQRDEATFHGDVAAAGAWLDRYFSPRDPRVQGMRDGLRGLAQAPLALRDADVDASLAVLRAWRGGKP